MSDEILQIQAQQDELNRKLNEKISDDLSKFQKAIVICIDLKTIILPPIQDNVHKLQHVMQHFQVIVS